MRQIRIGAHLNTFTQKELDEAFQSLEEQPDILWIDPHTPLFDLLINEAIDIGLFKAKALPKIIPSRLKIIAVTKESIVLISLFDRPAFSKLDTRPKILYTGLRCPSPLYSHVPTIRVEKIPFTPPAKNYSHLLLTGQTALEIFKPHLDVNIPAICINTKTAELAHDYGLDTYVLNEENLDKLHEVVQTLQVEKIVWPRSTQQKSVITQFCKEKGIQLIEIPVYKAIPIPLKANINNFDAIIFTSPSTLISVEHLPPGIKVYAESPITAQALRNKWGSDLIIEKGVPYATKI